MALVIAEQVNPKVLRIVLNDPDNLNAMGEDMAREFAAVTQNIKSSAAGLRAIILTGAGRAFSAGGNLEMLEKKRSQGGEENRLKMLDFYYSFLGMLSLDVPIIAAINGHAIGAGLCVAAACDIRIAAEGAKLGFTFVKLGLHPGMGATYFLPRVIGASAAAELMLTGRVIDPSEAQRIGLVSKVTPLDKLQDAALGIADEICGSGPEATRQLLESTRRGFPRLEEALQREALCQSINYAGAEFAEGVKAVKEKRPPKF